MCSNIVSIGDIEGSGRGVDGWFDLKQAVVTFDHALRLPVDNAITIDFVNREMGLSARVPVELTAESARELIRVIEVALAEGREQHLTLEPTQGPLI